MTPRNVVLEGDAASVLATLAPESVDCVVTSPPYFRLRSYDAGPKELGQEAHVEGWVEGLRRVAAEAHRVLVPTGSFWLNVSDSYSKHPKYGAAAKSLLLGPERLVLALQADGWIIRNRTIWAKTTPLPSPIADRLTNGYEFVYHLVKQGRYFYDLDPIRLPLKSSLRPKQAGAVVVTPIAVLGDLAGPRIGLAKMSAEGRTGHPLGRNPTDVWSLPPGRNTGGHFATFPESLVRRPILATCPEHVCIKCGQPWRRSTEPVKQVDGQAQPRPLVPCGCEAATRPGLVLDPFVGSGSTLRAARALRRDGLGIELAPRYAQVARARAGYELEQDAA
ncbi:MAG TPA: site-specific DNA-methyltransferase [Baekduia sp.]|nr:site-specific DNA-methyltransferase [Baekduia sp.]